MCIVLNKLFSIIFNNFIKKEKFVRVLRRSGRERGFFRFCEF